MSIYNELKKHYGVANRQRIAPCDLLPTLPSCRA